LLFGTLAAVGGGLLDVVQHYTLRAVLAARGYAPLNYSRFLDYAARLVLLQRAGGGYLFIHRLLLEHFVAGKAAWEPPARGDDSAPAPVALAQTRPGPSSYSHPSRAGGDRTSIDTPGTPSYPGVTADHTQSEEDFRRESEASQTPSASPSMYGTRYRNGRADTP
jgi:hypothetical protein